MYTQLNCSNEETHEQNQHGETFNPYPTAFHPGNGMVAYGHNA